MRANEFLIEGAGHPIICVDVQPEYAYYGNNERICDNIIKFVAGKQTGPVLFFVNAERDGLSGDTVEQIKQYWEEVMGGEYNEEADEWQHPINWGRFQIADKGFGYLRSWMDQGIDAGKIVKTIRLMYQNKVNDSRQLFGGDESDTYEEGMKQLLGHDYLVAMGDPISVEWTSIAQLKRFNGAYIVGGGRDECLREVELLMNAFNVKYKRIDSLVY
jgi:hypothetical protein